MFFMKKMFLGLKNILELNKNNNIILEIEATKDDGSKVFATFDQFILLEEAVDDIAYGIPSYLIRNRNESYPIISLGNQSSFGVEGGQIILIKPSYLKSLIEKVEERSQFKHYHDMLYSYSYAKYFVSWF